VQSDELSMTDRLPGAADCFGSAGILPAGFQIREKVKSRRDAGATGIVATTNLGFRLSWKKQ
jgi:hypothetical protein